MPEATALAALRRDIDRKPHKIKSVLMDASIRKAFFGKVSNEIKAVKAFTDQPSNRSNALKTHPKVGTLHFFKQKERDNSLAWRDLSFVAIDGVIFCTMAHNLWNPLLYVAMVRSKRVYDIQVPLSNTVRWNPVSERRMEIRGT